MTTVDPIEKAKTGAMPAAQRVGVLLINLGTPDTADARGVRVYLKEFLSDPRVIENQGLVWQLVLNGIILRRRPRSKALDYRKIWNEEKNESPLKTITRSQAEKLAAALADSRHVVVAATAFSRCRSIRNIRPRPRRPSVTRSFACWRGCAPSRRSG